jgi:Ca-activated chloride channel family protein
MKPILALEQAYKQLLTAINLSFLFICFAHGQSIDDVHIVPAKAPDKLELKADSELHNDAVHSKPFRVEVNLVLVPVNVSDSMNRPVVTLKKEDFALYDEDKRQEIQYFSQEQSPVSVAILVDVSKSMSQKIDTERAAIIEFFKNANPDDEYFGITFSDRPRELVSSAQSIDEMERKLTAVQPGGPTAMLDAVYLAMSKLRSARYKRKAILILSDGGDNASQYTMREIKSLVRESDVQIYAVGLFETFLLSAFEEKMGGKWLGEITDCTGGRTITVDSREKVPEAAAEISRELRNQYMLGYRAPNSVASHWRKIKVKIISSTSNNVLRPYYKQGYITAE